MKVFDDYIWITRNKVSIIVQESPDLHEQMVWGPVT